jgi:endonuclease YncB( thermonuclease family)
VEGSSSYRCTVNGQDLSRVVLFNGGGRTNAEATPELLRAEDHARDGKLGVWKR